MPVNKYFNQYSKVRTNEQLLYEDMIVESIRVYGHDIYYMPRENWADTDMLYGENVASRFEKAYQIEMMVTDVAGMSGNKDMFSRFGLEIQDNATFVVSRRSFERYVPSTVSTRPKEGDLLWVPVLNRIFEIKFIEEESLFFSLGNKQPYVYEMRCELFRYSNEVIDTGIEEIDTTIQDSSYTIQMIVTGNGNFTIGETVYQGNSFANATMTATVSDWDSGNSALYLVDIAGDMSSNQSLTGVTSNTVYTVTLVDTLGDYASLDSWDNKIIQDESNNFIVLIEQNPFGIP